MSLSKDPGPVSLDAVTISHWLLERVVRKGDRVVDATLGKGLDAAVLGRLVGGRGKVYAFEVQEKAQRRAEANLIVAGFRRRVVFHQANHAEWEAHLPEDLKGQLGAVVFNLGYLPGGDKEVTTQATTTLQAVQKAVDWLRVGGLLVVVMYPGHATGEEEREHLLGWSQSLPAARWQAWHMASPLPHKRPAPQILTLLKRK